MQVYSIKHMFASKRITNKAMNAYTLAMLASLPAALAEKLMLFKYNYTLVHNIQIINDALVAALLDAYFKNHACTYLKGTKESALFVSKVELNKFLLSTAPLHFETFKNWILKCIASAEQQN